MSSLTIEVSDPNSFIQVAGKPRWEYNKHGNLACRKEGVYNEMASKNVTASLVDDHGTWTVRGRVYDPDTGETKQRSKSTGYKVKANTKRRAEAKMQEIVEKWKEECEAGSRAASPVFAVYLQKFIDRKRRLRTKANTIKSYQDYIQNHIKPQLGGIPIGEMTLQDIEGFYTEYLKSHTVDSARKVNCVVSGAFREAIRDGMTQVNLADSDHLEFPKAKKYEGGTAYTAREAAMLLDAAKAAGEPIRAAITLGVCYGLRRSEVCGLRWKDIDYELGTLTVCNTVVSNGSLWIESEATKTANSHRTIDLFPNTIPYLKELKKAQEEAGLTLDKVCVWPNGEEVRPDYITRKTKKLMKEKGLRIIRFHDLRHTAASLLAPAVSPQQLQRFMGHEDISTTYGTYAHLMDKERKATSEAMNRVFEKAGVLF